MDSPARRGTDDLPAGLSGEVIAGQAAYTPLSLRLLYDPVVLGVSNRVLWRCPTRRLLRFYNENVSANHLDVGVATGYYPAHCRFPATPVRLGLMDLNEHCLRHAAQRTARYKPLILRRNVLEPISFDGSRFDSVALLYLLHCLPGAMKRKASIFDHLRPLMNDGAVLLGATIVQGSAPRNRAARRLMALYNARGIFSNTEDTAEALEASLAARFELWHVEVQGCVALFQAVSRTVCQ